MRRRSVQLSILIIFIVALSAASLAFRDININLPGFPALVRGGDGPLGLKLGLDLSGGGHLVYQADTGTRMEVGFADPTRGVIVENALGNLGVVDYEMRQSDDRTYIVTTDLLDDAVKEGIQDAIAFSRIEFSFDPEHWSFRTNPRLLDIVGGAGTGELSRWSRREWTTSIRITTTSLSGRGTAVRPGVGPGRRALARSATFRWKRWERSPSPSARFSPLRRTRWRASWTGLTAGSTCSAPRNPLSSSSARTG